MLFFFVIRTARRAVLAVSRKEGHAAQVAGQTTRRYWSGDKIDSATETSPAGAAVLNLLMCCCSMCRQQRSLVYCHYGSGFRGQHQEHGEATAPHTHAVGKLAIQRHRGTAGLNNGNMRSQQHTWRRPTGRDVTSREEKNPRSRRAQRIMRPTTRTAPLCHGLRDRAVGVEGTASLIRISRQLSRPPHRLSSDSLPICSKFNSQEIY